jgi:hypothetical protein
MNNLRQEKTFRDHGAAPGYGRAFPAISPLRLNPMLRHSGRGRYRGPLVTLCTRREQDGFAVSCGVSVWYAAEPRVAALGQVPGMPGLRAVTCALFRVSVVMTAETRNKAGFAGAAAPDV